MSRSFDAVICGAGIVGVSAAHFLSRAGLQRILLLDERPPLSFTSDRSTECYRNWWPDPAMLALMNRSIDLMEQLAEATRNAIRLNRRGYLYVTGDASKIASLKERAARIAVLGAGPLRVHETASAEYRPSPPDDFSNQPVGADLLLEPALIHRHFPGLTERAVAALHVRRAGWLSAQQLGVTLLEAARGRGVRFESARVDAIEVRSGRVQGIRLASGEGLTAPVFINAAGPFLQDVGRLLGVDLPVRTELHLKAVINDPLGAVDRRAPLLIWDDPQQLPWNEEEQAALADDPETRWLTGPFASGVHTRPEGGADSQSILMLWEYRQTPSPPVWPPQVDPRYAEVALRGLSTMLPRLCGYFERMPRPQVDGGYYTRTVENRPLVGPLEVGGAFVAGAVSGFGIMSACGVGELLAGHVVGGDLPTHAAAFTVDRYADPAYRRQIQELDHSGQL